MSEGGHPSARPGAEHGGSADVGSIVKRAAARWPERTALVADGRDWSYAELAEGVRGLAELLRVRGVQPGERVSILGDNSGAFLMATFAVARMRAVVRRSAPVQAAGPGSPGATEPGVAPAVVVGDVSIDPARHEVDVRGERIDLPLKEFSLLSHLMHNAGRVVTREILIDRIWGADYVGDTKTLDVHIKRLRSRIEDDPAKPTRIVTIRGLGYKYNQDAGS